MLCGSDSWSSDSVPEYSHTLTLSHVLEGGEHTEESDNAKERMRCGVPDTGVTFIFPRKATL